MLFSIYITFFYLYLQVFDFPIGKRTVQRPLHYKGLGSGAQADAHGATRCASQVLFRCAQAIVTMCVADT
jgi:hypothetical protein